MIWIKVLGLAVYTLFILGCGMGVSFLAASNSFNDGYIAGFKDGAKGASELNEVMDDGE